MFYFCWCLCSWDWITRVFRSCVRIDGTSSGSQRGILSSQGGSCSVVLSCYDFIAMLNTSFHFILDKGWPFYKSEYQTLFWNILYRFRCIVGHLDIAMRESVLNLSNLTVLTDATTQKIALKKWVANECKIQVRFQRQVLEGLDSNRWWIYWRFPLKGFVSLSLSFKVNVCWL